MTREEAKAYVTCHCNPDYPKGKTEWEQAVNMAIKALEQPEQRWIPVDIRNNSPEENKVVLLGVRFRDDFKYFVTSRQDYNYWTGLGREIKGELRWQALPEPYREEGEWE